MPLPSEQIFADSKAAKPALRLRASYTNKLQLDILKMLCCVNSFDELWAKLWEHRHTIIPLIKGDVLQTENL
jgi:hypothetical protein